MLFNDPLFLYAFLPLSVAFSLLVLRYFGLRAFQISLCFISLGFYAYTRFDWVFILTGSILVNFVASLALIDIRHTRTRWWIAFLTISLNVCLLIFFKYTDFLIANLSVAFKANWRALKIALPIGISFYTFQKIAYIVDTYKGKTAEKSFVRYVFFVTFFPQLIAGPITHHSEIFSQFRKGLSKSFSENISIGSTLFLIGLIKKVLLADTCAKFATPLFAAADAGKTIASLPAWEGVLAYTMQIYFDFSGYSDMAIGVAKMLGIRLPENFSSPYRSTSIVEFWRSWHMTLSRFLRDYIYIPLGGNRHGAIRRYINLFLTMLIGGIWHGAGWGFLIWGALHGFYLTINHALNAVFRRHSDGGKSEKAPFLPLTSPGFYFTFIGVMLAWVPFRAYTLDGALKVWQGLVDYKHPGAFSNSWPVAIIALVAILAPNSQALLRYLFSYEVGIDLYKTEPQETVPALSREPLSRWAISPPYRLAACMVFALMAVVALALNNKVSEFIYFQF